MKRLTSQSAPLERPKSADGVVVGQEVVEPKQESKPETSVKDRENAAAIKIQTAFRGLLVCFFLPKFITFV